MNFEADEQKKIMDMVSVFFQYDIDKICNWFLTSNPLLDNVAPIVMIRLGRTQKLLQFIQDQRDENGW